VGHVDRFIAIERTEGEFEILPVIKIDVSLEVVPPAGGEISFDKVRNILYLLKKNGMKVKWVTLDSYQSRDTMQILTRKGYQTGLQSMDVTPVPYMVTKQALYDGRLLIPEHELLRKELVSLERDAKTGKIDHPATCLHPNTKIRLVAGGCKTIKEMSEDWARGVTHEVYTYNEDTKSFGVCQAQHPRVTGSVVDMIQIQDDLGNEISCTPEHLILTKRGWVEAQDLESGDDIINLSLSEIEASIAYQEAKNESK
jgi:hypothetical protein